MKTHRPRKMTDAEREARAIADSKAIRGETSSTYADDARFQDIRKLLQKSAATFEEAVRLQQNISNLLVLKEATELINDTVAFIQSKATEIR